MIGVLIGGAMMLAAAGAFFAWAWWLGRADWMRRL